MSIQISRHRVTGSQITAVGHVISLPTPFPWGSSSEKVESADERQTAIMQIHDFLANRKHPRFRTLLLFMTAGTVLSLLEQPAVHPLLFFAKRFLVKKWMSCPLPWFDLKPVQVHNRLDKITVQVQSSLDPHGLWEEDRYMCLVNRSWISSESTSHVPLEMKGTLAVVWSKDYSRR